MRRVLSVFLPLSFLLVAACSSASPAHQQSTPDDQDDQGGQGGGTARAATSFTPWWTYHRTPNRAGHVAQAPGSPLKRAWSKKLGAAVYGEPLVVGSTLIVATERNKVFGLNARTGHVRWQTGLGRPQPMSGLPCGNIDPLGITGTPAYDPRTGSVFVVAETLGGAPHPVGPERDHRSPALAQVPRRAPRPQPEGRAGALGRAGGERARRRLLRRPGR